MLDLIAEIGSSPAPAWNFDAWARAAWKSGATHIKAQLFRAEHFPIAEQDSKRPLEFPRARLPEFAMRAHTYNLQAGISVFDGEAVTLAARACDFLKLASREQDNNDLHATVLLTNKVYYRSVTTLRPRSLVSGKETTLFCIPLYPTPMLQAVWGVIKAYRYFHDSPYRWGWSSHTRGDLDCYLAARLGADAIEKHLALSDKDIEAGHSLLPGQWQRMVKRING